MNTFRLVSLVLVICLPLFILGACRSDFSPAHISDGADDTQGDETMPDQNETLPLEEIREFIALRTLTNGNTFGDRLPAITSSGKYRFTDNGSWTGGFWPGLNLLVYEWTGNERYLEVARSSRWRLRDRLSAPESLDHDVGMLFVPSLAADYRITGDTAAKRLALEAAETLADRFNERGGYIRAWNDWMPENDGRMIIDTMQNLPLLFWAADETGNERYLQIASAHAETTARYLVRSDFTTGHTYVFDPSTGEPKYMRTHQGYSDSSCGPRAGMGDRRLLLCLPVYGKS